MGFASGFRTGLATGDVRRSAMPIVQGLGSMIDRIAARNKKGSVRFAGGSGGPSSYEKYTANKKEEEAAAEEKRRYETEQTKEAEALKSREAQETELKAQQEEQAAVTEQRAQETHASQMANQALERDKARQVVERSNKKEKRIEAYRALLQGIAAGNKSLTEEAFAALTPDFGTKEGEGGKRAKEWAPITETPVIDPETGQASVDPNTGLPYRKFTVGRDKEGNPSKKAMPAPSIDFNDDGSITAEFPTPDGVGNPVTYASADEFLDKAGIKHMNPEYETGGAADKKRKSKKEETRKDEKHQLALIKAEQTRIDKMISQEADPDVTDALQAKLDKRRQKITGGVEGKAAAGKTKMVAFKGKGDLAVEADKDNKPSDVKGAVGIRWSDEHEAWLAKNKAGEEFFIPAEK